MIDDIQARARELREAFDSSFARAASSDHGKAENFLGIRLGGDAYAVALAEITGLFADRKISFVPSRAAELLGVAGLRSDIIPVYSLRAFLGYGPASESQRWIMLAGELAAAFAFDRFDGYARIDEAELSSVPGNSSRGHIRATATVAGERRSIISVHSIVEEITKRSRTGNSFREHRA